MKTLERAAWLAMGALWLATGAVQAQTRPPAKPEGGVTPPATTPAPANPSAEPDSAGAIRYQGDPRGETESEAKAKAKGDPADARAPAKTRNDGKSSPLRRERGQEKPENGPVPRP